MFSLLINVTIFAGFVGIGFWVFKSKDIIAVLLGSLCLILFGNIFLFTFLHEKKRLHKENKNDFIH